MPVDMKICAEKCCGILTGALFQVKKGTASLDRETDTREDLRGRKDAQVLILLYAV